MTDRELLERAAKAAGIENLAPQGNVIICNDEDGYSAVWNPLTDDGDAFRLAVKIGINPGQCFQIVIDGEISRTGVRYSARSGGYDTLEEHGIDPYSATRRAIVLAAAAMAV